MQTGWMLASGCVSSRPVFHPEVGKLLEGLREARNWTQSEAAHIAKRRNLTLITRQVLLRLEAGKTRDPQPKVLKQMASLYGISYAGLIGELMEHLYGVTSAELESTARPVAIEGFVAVPLMADPIAAGSPLVIEPDENRDSSLAFREDFTRRFTRPICFRLGARERSMEPLLQPNDVVVVDQNLDKRKSPRAGRMFAVSFAALDEEPGGAIKRVEVDTKQKLMLISSENPDKSNPYYATRAFDVHDKRLQDILVGEVVWFGRYVVSKGKWW